MKVPTEKISYEQGAKIMSKLPKRMVAKLFAKSCSDHDLKMIISSYKLQDKQKELDLLLKYMTRYSRKI